MKIKWHTRRDCLSQEHVCHRVSWRKFKEPKKAGERLRELSNLSQDEANRAQTIAHERRYTSKHETKEGKNKKPKVRDNWKDRERR